MKCPFNHFKRCDPECELFRRGMRYWEDGRTPEPIEMCTFNYLADCMENLVTRQISTQATVDKLSTEIRVLSNLLGTAIEGRIKRIGG